jgi:purine-binding chemotaxis protein CheW
MSTPLAVSPAPPVAARRRPERAGLFRLGGRAFAVPGPSCKEFLSGAAVTRVPRAPSHILGITQLRGRILPVLDLQPLLGMTGRAAGEAASALVVAAAELEAALAIDEIIGFEPYRPAAFTPATANGPGTWWLAGHLSLDLPGEESEVAMLDAGRILERLRVRRG